MAQLLAKIRIQPAATPGNWQVQATIYDDVAQTFRTESVQVTDTVARDQSLLEADMDSAFGLINYSGAAPPTP